MKLFAGRSNLPLAKKIADSLGKKLGNLQIDNFPDGEIRVEFEDDIRNKNVYVIQSTNAPADNIMELLLILDAARRASAKSVVAVIPYMGYGRQDRKDRSRVPISARMFMDLITVVGVSRILTMDLHASQIQGFANVPFDHLYSRMALFSKLKKLKLNFKNGVILAPDAGSAKVSQVYAKKLGTNFALIDKRRFGPANSVVMNLIGELKGKRVLILDDMVDSGGTIINAANAAMEKGAIEVLCAATHPVLSGDAAKKLQDSVLSKVILCDTIYHEGRKTFPKRHQVSVSGIFSRAIDRIDRGKSLSTLFSEK